MKPKIKIDIVSDVVCPWCYIGKRRLEQAVASLSDTFEFELEYHPFELNPSIPDAGLNQKEYLTEKFGSEDHYHQITNRVTATAAAEGLTFDFPNQHRSPNTRKMHALIQLAKESGKQLPAVEAFFKAYFTDGIDLTNQENLISVAVQSGLDRQAVEKLLADENALVQVALQEKEMSKLNIRGVPFYIINNKYGISGAQASDTFVQAITQAGSEALRGETCDTEGNC